MKKVGAYQLKEELGSGSFGRVFKAYKENEPNVLYAIKMISKIGMPENNNKCLGREVEMLQIVTHENLLKFHNLVESDKNYYLICEYCNGGDLSRLCKDKGGKLEEPMVRRIIKQVVEGMNELHKKNAMHRDIKRSNILLHHPDNDHTKLIVKLGDFGFARIVEHKQKLGELLGESTSEFKGHMSIVGTPLNMAPELLRNEPYSFKADIWSLGIVLYEICCGRVCFSGNSRNDFIQSIDLGLYKVSRDNYLSVECLDFMNGCLQQNSQMRIKWKDVLEHPFICSDTYTNFDPRKFRSMNGGRNIVKRDELVFSSKIRYKFFPRLIVLQADKGEYVVVQLTNTVKLDYGEYVRVEMPEDISYLSSEQITLRLDKLTLEENHFK